MRWFEIFFEKSLYGMRWILAPLYLGLGLTLLLLTVKFALELFELSKEIVDIRSEQMVLRLLSLVDMSLVGNLLVMVMLSGYENFVSRLDLGDGEKLKWLGKLDAGSLKMRLAASIVAISSIHLLSIFFVEVEQIENSKVVLYGALHIIFVISALLMAIVEKFSHQAHIPDED